jgi:hypothetical protein
MEADMTLKDHLRHYSIPVLYLLEAWAIAGGAHPLIHAAIFGVLGIVHALPKRHNSGGNADAQPPPDDSGGGGNALSLRRP